VVEIGTVVEFAESPGGRAWFARRLAEARAKAGEAMFSLDPASPADLQRLAADARKRFDALPAPEKQRVAAWVDGKVCDACGRSLAEAFESNINAQTRWIADVMVSHMSDVHYQVRDRWRSELDSRFAAQLPVDSKKQLLGTLAMKGDATLVFRFTFYANG